MSRVHLQRRNDYTDGGDFFPTPPEFTRVLLRWMPELLNSVVWECACGDGSMSRVLAHVARQVLSTDKYDHGWGRSGVDFLRVPTQRDAEFIVTNPPFKMASGFIQSALYRLGEGDIKGVAMLLPVHIFGSASRYKDVWTKYPRPCRIVIICDRMKNLNPGGSSSSNFNHMWMVWGVEPRNGDTRIQFDLAYGPEFRGYQTLKGDNQ